MPLKFPDSFLRSLCRTKRQPALYETVQTMAELEPAQLASCKTLACKPSLGRAALAELRHRSTGLVLATASQFSHQRHRRTGKAGILGLSPCSSNC